MHSRVFPDHLVSSPAPVPTPSSQRLSGSHASMVEGALPSASDAELGRAELDMHCSLLLATHGEREFWGVRQFLSKEDRIQRNLVVGEQITTREKDGRRDPKRKDKREGEGDQG